MDQRELNEAIAAGEAALDSLDAVQTELRSAGNWGIVDILGGGFFVNMIKHQKLEQAQAHLDAADAAIGAFQRELKDLPNLPPQLTIEIDDMLSFADFIFDGVFADVMVQGKIEKAKAQVDETAHHIMDILDWLASQQQPAPNPQMPQNG